MDDYSGRLVRLDVRIVTGGGTVFEIGEVLRCRGHHRGALELHDPAMKDFNYATGRIVRKVPPLHVTLLPEETTP